MIQVSGFVIVEKPYENRYDFQNHSKPVPLKIGQSIYCGIGRQWGIHYFGNSKVDSIIDKAKEVYSHTMMYKVIDNIESAELLLDQINSNHQIDICCEIIAINNETVKNYMGLLDLPDQDFLRMGIDIETEYSLPIKDDIFFRKINGNMIPEFEKHLNKLNKFGLFESEIDVMSFMKEYYGLQELHNLEKIDLNRIEMVEIFGKSN